MKIKTSEDEKIEKVKNKLYVGKSLLGKAGEYLVAGRLLLNGFKVYTETVDDGMDLIAKKKNKFYFFQVKTCQDTNYDSGHFQARINFDTFSKFPKKRSFIVFVLHYLGPNASLDNMGDHNTYDQMYIPIPSTDFCSFFPIDNCGYTNVRLELSLVMDGQHDFIVRMKIKNRTIPLDKYLIGGFWQVEI